LSFIVDHPEACSQCNRVLHPDGFPVTWVCIVCRRLVCRFCCLHGVDGAILEDTLCSKDCRIILTVERTMNGGPIENED
jgi:hypothetical protein